MTPEEQFLRDHRFCVVSTIRKDGAPQSTPVYYIYENGKLYISVTKTRKKALNAIRDPRVSAVVLAEEEPFKHVQVQGTAIVTDENLLQISKRVWSTFRNPLPDNFQEMLQSQGRTLMVITPVTITSNLASTR